MARRQPKGEAVATHVNEPEIMKRYLRLSTAYEIWTALSKAFYDGSDELQVFTLNQKAFTSK